MIDNGIISGGISGGISDPYSERAMEHAKLFYEEMRHTNSDVAKIAENTGYSFEQILQIKNYLFVDEHFLDGEVKRFMPCFEIAESWRRLAYDPVHILPHDRTLLKHEIHEMELINQGYSQTNAHDITEMEYNYRAESIDYYKSLGYDPRAIYNSTQKNQNSGGIKRKAAKTNWEERY